MDGVLFVICLAVAALFVVAIGVAWWEQARDPESRRRPLPPGPPSVPSVDVELELPTAPAPAPPGDQRARQAMMGNAMSRMTGPAAAPSSLAWGDTLPTGEASRPGQRPAPEAEPSTRH